MNEATTPRALPALIPVAGTKEQVPLALATREQLETFTVVAEQFARTHAAEHADLKGRLAQWEAALAYFPPHALADMTLAHALELRGRHESTEANETKGSIARAVAALRTAIDREALKVESMNAIALAARTAIALFREGDPPSLTYAQAYGRTQAATGAPLTVNVPPAGRVVRRVERDEIGRVAAVIDEDVDSPGRPGLVATVQPA